MPFSASGHQKVWTCTSANQRQQHQYIYRHGQLGHVIPGHAILVAVCIFMLPMLEVAAEHKQLTTTHHTNPDAGGHLVFSHTPPCSAIILQQPITSHGPPKQSSEVEHVFVTLLFPLKHTSYILWPVSQYLLQCEEGGDGGCFTAVAKWRHRDKPGSCW